MQKALKQEILDQVNIKERWSRNSDKERKGWRREGGRRRLMKGKYLRLEVWTKMKRTIQVSSCILNGSKKNLSKII